MLESRPEFAHPSPIQRLSKAVWDERCRKAEPGDFETEAGFDLVARIRPSVLYCAASMTRAELLALSHGLHQLYKDSEHIIDHSRLLTYDMTEAQALGLVGGEWGELRRRS